MLISGATYQRLYGRLPNISFNDYTAASSKLSALRQPAKQSGKMLAKHEFPVKHLTLACTCCPAFSNCLVTLPRREQSSFIWQLLL